MAATISDTEPVTSFIKVQLFGPPSVTKDDQPVIFPFKKAEALFYYLLIRKQATRDELATLLWTEENEEKAKKNLRNALYKIKKAFGSKIIIARQKQMVMLDPDIHIESDADGYLNPDSENPGSGKGEFLQGFLVKGAENFLDWVRDQNDFFRELFIMKLNQRLEKSLEKGEDANVELDANLLIQTDKYDERGYRILMRAYARKGQFNKVIEINKRLVGILEKELGITPDKKTKDLYLEILNRRNAIENKVEKKTDHFFVGRKRELLILREDYNEFIHHNRVRSIMIMGEAGIGKTSLKEEFKRTIRTAEINLLEAECFQAEEEYVLKPWNVIFSQLYVILQKEKIQISAFVETIIGHLFPAFSKGLTQNKVLPLEKLDTLKPKVIEDAVLGVLQQVAQKKKILLIIDDVQWLDAMSLSLLNHILLHTHNQDIFFLGTLRTGFNQAIEKFMTVTSRYQRLMQIELDRFSKNEVKDFVRHSLPNLPIDDKLNETVYQETEGNPFFINEFLNVIKEKKDIHALTPRMQDILKSRIIGISQEGKKMLNIVSLFFDEVTLDILQSVCGKNDFEIMEIMEELKNKFIIREIAKADSVCYRFTHHKLRDFIYDQQSLASKRILHNKVGLLLEKDLKKDKHDFLLYPHLIYHFTNARNWKSTLKYTIDNAKLFLDFSHELFPELRDPAIQGDFYLQVSPDMTRKYLNDIDNLLTTVKTNFKTNPELIKLQVEYLHMKGRYLIREGEYDEGIRLIEEMIKESRQIKDFHYMLKGFIQLIFYSIQTYDISGMSKNLQLALNLASHHHYKKEMGTLLRLKGINLIMAGEYQKAESLLKNSITIFSHLNLEEDKFSLCIAAANYYLGEIRRYSQNFTEALSFYDQAIAISKEKKAFGSLAVFNTQAGQAAYHSKDLPRAARYFADAIEMYDKFETVWGRSTAEGYYSLWLINEKNYPEALNSLKNADFFAQKLKSPNELAIVYRIKAKIRTLMKTNPDLSKTFAKTLNLTVNEYCTRGIEIAAKANNIYEQNLLKKLNKK